MLPIEIARTSESVDSGRFSLRASVTLDTSPGTEGALISPRRR